MSAMCALAFFAFLRIGGLTASRGNTTNIINLSQLDRLVDAQGRIQALQLTLHNYKHKNSGPPFVIFIYPERSQKFPAIDEILLSKQKTVETCRLPSS